jgi:hypothetical protein
VRNGLLHRRKPLGQFGQLLTEHLQALGYSGAGFVAHITSLHLVTDVNRFCFYPIGRRAFLDFLDCLVNYGDSKIKSVINLMLNRLK